MTEMNETEVVEMEAEAQEVEQVETTPEVSEEVEQLEMSEVELKALLDEVLGSTQTETDWPNFDPKLVAELQTKKELEEEIARSQELASKLEALELLQQEADTKTNDLMSQLEELSKERAEFETANVELMELYQKIMDTPVVSDFVKSIAEGKEVNIPKALAALRQANINAQSTEPRTETIAAPIQKAYNAADTIRANILQKNRL